MRKTRDFAEGESLGGYPLPAALLRRRSARALAVTAGLPAPGVGGGDCAAAIMEAGVGGVLKAAGL